MVEPGFIISVSLLSVADYASKLLDRIGIWRRRGRLDEVSVVTLAPRAKPPHHG